MDTTTLSPTPTARKVRAIKAPRAGSITAHIIAAIARAEVPIGSRDIINRIAQAGGPTVPLRTLSATLAILRARGNVASRPMLGAEHGQMVYSLTMRGEHLAALMVLDAHAPAQAEGAPDVA